MTFWELQSRVQGVISHGMLDTLFVISIGLNGLHLFHRFGVFVLVLILPPVGGPGKTRIIFCSQGGGMSFSPKLKRIFVAGEKHSTCEYFARLSAVCMSGRSLTLYKLVVHSPALDVHVIPRVHMVWGNHVDEKPKLQRHAILLPWVRLLWCCIIFKKMEHFLTSWHWICRWGVFDFEHVQFVMWSWIAHWSTCFLFDIVTFSCPHREPLVAAIIPSVFSFLPEMFALISRQEKLELLLRVFGNENLNDRELAQIMLASRLTGFENYALTFDNILKMFAIYFRVKSRIPVVRFRNMDFWFDAVVRAWGLHSKMFWLMWCADMRWQRVTRSFCVGWHLLNLTLIDLERCST